MGGFSLVARFKFPTDPLCSERKSRKEAGSRAAGTTTSGWQGAVQAAHFAAGQTTRRRRTEETVAEPSPPGIAQGPCNLCVFCCQKDTPRPRL